MIESSWEPKIVAFLCHWCSYAGADLAGVSRMQYPPNIRVIRVPCSGAINPLYIFKALREGADGVLVSGCHPGDCHYISGNYYARRKFYILRNCWSGRESKLIVSIFPGFQLLKDKNSPRWSPRSSMLSSHSVPLEN